MSKRIFFHTFGCRLNQAETATLRSDFRNSGYHVVDNSSDADMAVINTCTVTENGDSDTIRMVNRISGSNPNVRIALIGCQAQLQAKRLADLPNVHWVVGNSHKDHLRSIVEDDDNGNVSRKIVVEAVPRSSFTIPVDATEQEATRANLKIQDGCDFYCLFCVIPYARGRARSRDFYDIVREARNLTAANYKELVITGVNIGTYQFEGFQFLDVITALKQIPGLARLRVSSIEPTTIPEEILDHMRSGSTLCRYLHIPLQSGSDEILFKMNRRYTVSEYSDFVIDAYRKVKDICIGTDVIVGYPGESATLFDETYELLQSLPLNYFHVFSYSERADAKSQKLAGSVPGSTIKKRSKILRNLSDRKRHAYMTPFIGTTQAVLFEQEKRGYWSGLTDNFIRVLVKSDQHLSNELVPVRFDEIDGNRVIGTIV